MLDSLEEVTEVRKLAVDTEVLGVGNLVFVTGTSDVNVRLLRGNDGV